MAGARGQPHREQQQRDAGDQADGGQARARRLGRASAREIGEQRVEVGAGARREGKLGFGPVSAVDDDPLAVQATAANARANRVAVEVRRADLRSDPLPGAPTVVANLLRPLLLAVAGRLPDPPPRTLIASGLLRGECDEVAAAFAARGLRERERRVEGEWAALRLGPA